MWFGPSKKQWQEQSANLKTINGELGCIITRLTGVEIGQRWLKWIVGITLGMVVGIFGVLLTLVLRLSGVI